MVGTVASSTTVLINCALPLGITKSTNPEAFNKAVTVPLSSDGTNWITSGEIEVPVNPFRITSIKILLLCSAEEDPRNKAALPDLIKITAASTVTFGLAS